MTVEPAPQLDLTLRALADPNRRAILGVVRGGAQPVGAIAEAVGLSQQTTSHHLRVLHDAGLATSSREGTRHLYAIRKDGVEAVREYLEDFWPTKLGALRAAAEAAARGARTGGATDG